MDGHQKFQFFPPAVVLLGVATWLVLTISNCHLVFDQNVEKEFGITGIAILLALLSVSLGCVVAWLVLLITLIFNWSVASRRHALCRPLREWTKLFTIVTAIGVCSILFDSD